MICEHVRHSGSHAGGEVGDLASDVDEERVAGPAAELADGGVIAAG